VPYANRPTLSSTRLRTCNLNMATTPPGVAGTAALVRARTARIIMRLEALVEPHRLARQNDEPSPKVEFYRRSDDALADFVALRAETRQLHIGMQAQVRVVEPAAKAAETARLAFENLSYEREMLRREVTMCQSYKAADLDAIKLVSVEELKKAANAAQDTGTPPDPVTRTTKRAAGQVGAAAQTDPAMDSNSKGSANNVTGSEMRRPAASNACEMLKRVSSSKDLKPSDRVHIDMFTRLEYELQERKRLREVADEFTNDRKRRKLQNHREKDFLRDLPTRVTQVLQSVLPLREFFDEGTEPTGATFTPSLMPKDEDGVLRDLPEPLFVLAREAIAFRDAFRGAISVKVLTHSLDASDGMAPVLAKPKLPPFVVSAHSNAEIVYAGAAKSSLETARSLHHAHEKMVLIDLFEQASFVTSIDLATTPPATRAIRKRGTCSPGASRVAAQVSSNQNREPVLSLEFRLLPKLGIVTVSGIDHSSSPVVDVTNDLCVLFPFDYGSLSPNQSNAHLLDGQFVFDRNLVAKRGRPYVWANLLCGLHFPGSLGQSRLQDGVRERTVRGDYHQFDKWHDVAATYPTHLRFHDMFDSIHRRMVTVRSLRSQKLVLGSKKLPLGWKKVGLPSEPKTKLDMFTICPPEVSGEGLELTAGSSDTYTEVWAFEVSHPSGIKLEGLIGIHPNYPTSAAQFRLKPMQSCEVADADIREMEAETNNFGNRFMSKRQRGKVQAYAPLAPGHLVRSESGKRGIAKSMNVATGGCEVVMDSSGAEKRSGVGGGNGDVADEGGGVSSVADVDLDDIGGGDGGDVRPSEDVDDGSNCYYFGSKVSKIPDSMMLSVQILKLLACVDVLAEAMNAKVVTGDDGDDDDDNQALDSLMDIEHAAGTRNDSGVTDSKTTRVTRGRSRSKFSAQ
jgi:Fms-interacting protein/Thoc5